MTYTAFSSIGPRIAPAISEDLLHWQWLGLATFEPYYGIDFVHVGNPVLTPLLREERHGIVPNVVFPTGIDRRDDIGSPDRFGVYYGMADSRIGVARLDMPVYLPSGVSADAHGQKPKSIPTLQSMPLTDPIAEIPR
jgi:predicted GH43/DUF377 family glycosyl hydrolase